MRFRAWPMAVALSAAIVSRAFAQSSEEALFLDPVDVRIPHVSTDAEVRLDYDIVYVRAQRAGDEVHKRYYADFSAPITIEPGADLMLLHPNGDEERLVAGGDGAITDPVVSFDGRWVYFTRLYNMRESSQWDPPREGADIFKIHVETRRLVRLTNQAYSPNTGAADWSADFRTPAEGKSYLGPGVYNMGPCPLPGGRLAFTSNRDGFRPAKGYPAVALQLFAMDDRDESIGEGELPKNLEKIGWLNVSGALHPVALSDGRIVFSSLESQGARSDILWGVWTIHPDGTNWNPLVSAFDPGGAPNGFHFQTQLSSGSIVVEQYYNQNNSGFGAYIKLPLTSPQGYAPFGPAYMDDPRNPPWRQGRFDNGKGKYYRMPFMPTWSVSLTPFSHGVEGPADPADIRDRQSPGVGKFTHPSGAPDNHLLTVYSPGPVNHQYKFPPQLDGGIYLLKNGEAVEQPAQLRLIKNDSRFNEQWPRALVPYRRVHGIDRPALLPESKNDGRASPHLPEGTPFGLVGTSSFYKRESYPNGRTRPGSVTSVFAGGEDPWKGLDPFQTHGNGMPLNWHNQGADAGLFENDEIHAVRVLAMEPTTARKGANDGRRFYNHAKERLRILGEIPLRKFTSEGQPTDPDGNPDTSFLAKIPADTAFTFQTLDGRGLVLNAAQTWHQLRPGEIRTNCGGCHAHSQQPTEFGRTRASQADYPVWDLVGTTPLLVDKARDESQRKWDANDRTGLRTLRGGPLNVEYHRNIRPILQRSCVGCHSAKQGRKPAASLDLDADHEFYKVDYEGEFPGTYYRLAKDDSARFGHKPVGWESWGAMQASRYIRKLQARRSLLAWKVFGQRLDGFGDDDHPSEARPGEHALMHLGKAVDVEQNRSRQDLDYVGEPMPPPQAVAAGKAAPLSDEDKRTIARWIDLGCPIDQDYDPERPDHRGSGWMLDENRPVLTLTLPRAGKNESLARVLVGMHDYLTGLDLASLSIVADFTVDGATPGTNLAGRFRETSTGVWEWRLERPVADLPRGTLKISVRDLQGNLACIERTLSVEP